MAGEPLALEALHQPSEAVAFSIHIGIVDLVRIPGKHDFGALAHPSHDRLHLVGGEVLGLVHHHELARNRTTADVADRLHLEQAHALEVCPIAAWPAVTAASPSSTPPLLLTATEQKVEVVDDWLHPGTHFFVQIAWEKADLLAEGNHRAGHQQALVEPLVGHLVQPSGQGEQGFTGAGLAHQGDQLDAGIQQQIKGKCLLPVAGLDAAELGLGRSLQRLQAGGGGVVASQQGVGRLGPIDQGYALVGLQRRLQHQALRRQS